MNEAATSYDEVESGYHYARMIPGRDHERQIPNKTLVRFGERTRNRRRFRDYWNELRQQASLRAGAARRVLIVGSSASGRSIARALERKGTTEVRGFLDDRQIGAARVLGRIEDLARIARAEFIDEVIVALPSHSIGALQACEIARRNHLDVRMSIALPGGTWPKPELERIGETPVLSLHRETFPRAALVLKRIIDIAGSLVALLFVWPVMALIALAIRIDSAGPAIYSAERMGTRGRRFRCYKFRSMVQDAEHLQEGLRSRNQRQGPIFKLEDDPRITRVGRIIRRYSLDELPQLWNVLRGDMSLVGPRPHPMADVRRYELHDYRRLDVKPGMTGLWQVTARKDPSFRRNMHLDLTYIENWNLLLDIRILLLTVRALFSPDGA